MTPAKNVKNRYVGRPPDAALSFFPAPPINLITIKKFPMCKLCVNLKAAANHTYKHPKHLLKNANYRKG